MESDLSKQPGDFDRTVELCIEAYEAVLKHGTLQMREAARLLLAATGREIAKRIASEPDDE